VAKRSLTYGWQPVLEALEIAPEAARRLVVSNRRRRDVEKLLAVAERHGVSVEWVEPPDLDALCGNGNHQGVALEGREFAYQDFEVWLSELSVKPRATVLMLDQIQDPNNLGAILRTAAACGVAGVILPERRAALVTPAVIKASAGQALRVPVAQVVNVARALEQLKEVGFWVLGAATRAGQAPWEVKLPEKVVVVLGSEGAGMRRLVEEACDLKVSLPLAPGVESLNVSVAGAMLLYEVVRQGATRG
jgi:23S rRNA (guanosine2251-2'-O)-methyltransferase